MMHSKIRSAVYHPWFYKIISNVMSSEASVSHTVHGGEGVSSGQRPPSRQRSPSWQWPPHLIRDPLLDPLDWHAVAVTAAVGTLSTGMHCCLICRCSIDYTCGSYVCNSRGGGTCFLLDRTSDSTSGSISGSASGQTFIHNDETRLFVKSIIHITSSQKISNGA